jgi:hypothetical protein
VLLECWVLFGVREQRLQRVRVHRSGDLMACKLSLSLLPPVGSSRVVLLAPKEFCHQFMRS